MSSVVWTRLNESRGLPEAAGVDRVVQLDNIHPDTFEALQILIDLPPQPVARRYVVRPDPPLTPRDVIELHQMFEQFEAKDEAYDLLYALVKRHAIALTLDAVNSQVTDDFFTVVKAVPGDECAALVFKYFLTHWGLTGTYART